MFGSTLALPPCIIDGIIPTRKELARNARGAQILASKVPVHGPEERNVKRYDLSWGGGGSQEGTVQAGLVIFGAASAELRTLQAD